ncbi:MAG: hypothetical protein COT90_05435 [Candidatus Diapherotrites archaeon CG10_big_fil_rev_8_21_14_0_10_31_34]|nr:MAG: hypothetical protein COT90_05435 [Candidatus Diapherotrites archaeon CG10_big_fil_rev_8_21_14_0_10_31_34]PJA17410.1 MAG: hypothetical protein COX63_02785 [Candidatus Diapherotrites archaeon CG_4_10_14_0_2_um_filter_31_5]
MFLYVNKQYYCMDKIDFLNKDSFDVLELLIKKKQYLRELAEKSGLAPSSVHKIMNKLYSKKIVLAEKTKNLKFFSLNYDSPLTASILRIIFISKITDCKGFKKLVKLNPLGIYLFGSTSKGKIMKDSDIDLAVFFRKKPDSIGLTGIKRELSSELEKEIQLIVLTENKINSMKKEKTLLLEEIKNNSVVLFGEELE